ncbi:hypothetical protein V8G54_026423 [Vigna mungo]|uniref:Integrase catalytic domain-containing protein n=1 Tax=Vigna mungo TaxID=3915 RepID=A0AAQ3RM56_VIGMU
MHKQIRDYVLNCTICQQAKTATTLPAGLLQPLPVPSQIWEQICMDFITALPPAQGYSVIMVVIDRLSKFVHFLPLKHDFSSQQVAETFVQHILKLHGFPRSIISDRDKIFISKFWQQLFKLQGTTLSMSSAYHPQTDGQSEILNKTLEMYLRCYCFDNPKNWVKMLPSAQYWYNTSYHNSIKMSPYKALYGREPPSLIRYEIFAHDDSTLQQILVDRDRLLDQLRTNMTRSQQFMKYFADKHRRHEEFKEGDLVLVKLQPYRQHSVALRKHQKIGLRYFGPFKISHKLSSVAYKLELPSEAKIHNVFHISLLKKFRGEYQQHYLPLPLKTSEWGPIISPTAVLDNITISVAGKELQQIQVQWEEGEHSFTTWEPTAEFYKAYPEFNLEDKVVVNGEGNVRKKNNVEVSTNADAEMDGHMEDIMHKETNPELVTGRGQLANSEIKEPRRSSRKRISNRRLQDLGYYTTGKEAVTVAILSDKRIFF